MVKSDLWCSYCRGQEFTEHPDPKHPHDSAWSSWECNKCHAFFEDNSGYGYFTSYWGNHSSCTPFKFNPNTGAEVTNG